MNYNCLCNNCDLTGFIIIVAYDEEEEVNASNTFVYNKIIFLRLISGFNAERTFFYYFYYNVLLQRMNE